MLVAQVAVLDIQQILARFIAVVVLVAAQVEMLT